MKTLKIIGTVLLSTLTIAGFSMKGYNIEAKISGDANGKKVYLFSPGASKSKPVDSAVIEKNSFVFKGEVAYPALFRIKIMKNPVPAGNAGRNVYQPVIPLFIENSAISLSALLDSIPDELKLMMNTYTYKDIVIKGSASNDLYLSYLAKRTQFDTKRSDIFMNEYIAYLNPKKGEVKGKVSTGTEIVTRIDKAAAEREVFVKQYIKENADNYIGLYAAESSLGLFPVADIDEILSFLKKGGLLGTDPGKQLAEKAEEVKKTAIGSNYVDLTLQDQNGKTVRFSDFVAKGKYVLLEFWASWCGPCKADLPHLKEVYNLYHPAGFDVVSVSVDDNKEAWVKAINEFDLVWPQVSDLKAFKGDVTKIYGISGVPTCILVGPNGTIITRNMRGSWMDKKLIELYGNKFGDMY
jgi:thiol-disulfide isomerase/thioredoxin